MNLNRRGFLSGLAAVTAVAVSPAIWVAKKARSLLINVKDHGAVGDGETDDTLAFQSALNACGPGDKVFVPAGTYRFDPESRGIRLS